MLIISHSNPFYLPFVAHINSLNSCL